MTRLKSEIALALLLLLLPAAARADEPGYGPQYAADRAEIMDLEARYMFALDWQDAEAYAATFTQDGVLDWAGGVAKGRSAIMQEVENMKAEVASRATKNPDLRPSQRRHFLTNYVLKIDGDHATGVAYWFEMLNDNPERSATVPAYGHYEDELRKVDGRWLFSKRKIFNEQMDSRAAGKENPAR